MADELTSKASSRRTCCTVVLVAFAIVFIAGGACVFKILPPVIHDLVKHALIVDGPRASGFSSFTNSSSKTSIYQSFYLYHCNNPDQVAFEGALPNLTQIGPYVYLTTQWRDMGNISWKADGTVEYTYHETYDFQADLSFPLVADTDYVTTLNVGVIVAMYQYPSFAAALRDIALVTGTGIFVNVTVQQALFGYNNTFVSVLHDAIVLGEDLRLLNMTAPNPYVSIFTNDDPATFSAPSAIYTGGPAATSLPQPPANSQNQMTMWEGKKQLDFWLTPYANMINGTDGTCFTPGVSSTDSPYVFVDTLYRSVTLAFQQDETYLDVALLRFTLSQNDTLSQDKNPDNAAFGMTETGFLPTPLNGGYPFVFSKPHFLDANLSNVHLIGVSPAVRDDHETFLDAEPITGLLFRVHKRIQLNVFLTNATYGMNHYYNVSSTWFPVVWADESMSLPSNLVDDFKNDVMLPLHLAKYGGIAAMSFGGLLIIVAVLVFVCCKPKQQHVFHSQSELESQKLNSEYGY